MVTLKEIARECNVSPTTVSNILNGKPKVSEETRERECWRPLTDWDTGQIT